MKVAGSFARQSSSEARLDFQVRSSGLLGLPGWTPDMLIHVPAGD